MTYGSNGDLILVFFNLYCNIFRILKIIIFTTGE